MTHLVLEKVDEGRGDVDPVENADHRRGKVLDLWVCSDRRGTLRDVLHPDRLSRQKWHSDRARRRNIGGCTYVLDVPPVIIDKVCRRDYDT